MGFVKLIRSVFFVSILFLSLHSETFAQSQTTSTQTQQQQKQQTQKQQAVQKSDVNSSSIVYTAEKCNERRDFLPTCTSLSVNARCSRELTDLCCGCQSTWLVSLPYCSFSLLAFPLPTPINTPIATPTPIGGNPSSPDSPAGTTVSGYTCNAGVTSFFLEGKPAAGTSQTYDWSFTCRDSQGNENLEKVSGAVVRLTDSGKTLSVVLPTPATSNEIVCSSEFKVFKNGVLEQSYKGTVLVTSCELGCTSKDQYPSLIEMDGIGALQRKLGASAIALMLKAKTINKKKATTLRKELGANYIKVWSSTWTMPLVVAQCNNAVLCSSENQESKHSTYLANVATADVFLKKLLRTKRNLTAKQLKQLKAMKTKADKAQRAALARVATLSDTSSVCSAAVDVRLSPIQSTLFNTSVKKYDALF